MVRATFQSINNTLVLLILFCFWTREEASRKEYTILFVPRKTLLCERQLQVSTSRKWSLSLQYLVCSSLPVVHIEPTTLCSSAFFIHTVVPNFVRKPWHNSGTSVMQHNFELSFIFTNAQTSICSTKYHTNSCFFQCTVLFVLQRWSSKWCFFLSCNFFWHGARRTVCG